MTHAPGIEILGPALYEASPENQAGPLWSARLAIVGDIRSGSVVEHNFGLRVLLQDDTPAPLRPQSKWEDRSTAPVPFFFPRLVHGIARSADRLLPYFFSCDSLTIAGAVGRLRSDPAPQTLIAAPLEDWPKQERATLGAGLISFPRFRLAAGRIRVTMLLRRIRRPLQKLLGVRLGREPGTASLFDSLTTRVRRIGNNWSLDLDLTPQGIEFDACFPHPGSLFLDISGKTEVWLRVRLVSEPPDQPDTHARARRSYRLVLIGAADAPELRAASAQAVQEIVDGLSRAFGSLRQEGDLPERLTSCPLRVDFDSRPPVPPLYWALRTPNKGRGDSAGKLVYEQTKSWRCGLDTRVIRARIVSGDGGVSAAEVIPQVVEIEHTKSLRQTHIKISTGNRQADYSGPNLCIAWERLGGHTIDLAQPPLANGQHEPGQDFPVAIDTNLVAEHLARIYHDSRALPETENISPYAFILLNRGILQIPLPLPPGKSTPAERGVRRPETRVFRGLVVFALDGRMWQSVELDTADQVTSIIKFTPPSGNAAILSDVIIEARGARGVLHGFLWSVESSPTPLEVIPNLRNGPVATREIPLRFGAEQSLLLPIKCSPLHVKIVPRAVRGDKRRSITLTFERLPNDVFSADQLWAKDLDPQVVERLVKEWSKFIAWQPHESLPLVSAAAMTRSAASADEPCYSRGMMPFQLCRTAASTSLTRFFDELLPRLKPESLRTATHADWPWPATQEKKESTVSMLPLALPGIELAPQDPASMNWGTPRAALRFDLPILDELYSGTQLPKTTDPSAQAENQPLPPDSPTALDLTSLARYWRRAAEKLSLALTARTHAVSMARPAGAVVSVEGLVEPYVWHTTFLFHPLCEAADRQSRLPLGRYEFANRSYAGDVALRGLHDSFRIENGELKQNGNIQVVGFAPGVFESGNLRFDNRGFGVAPLALPLSSSPAPAAYSRTTRIATAGRAPDYSEPIELLTLTKPVELRLPGSARRGPRGSFASSGDKRGFFWFRDLPMERSSRDGTLTFEATKGVESMLGPNREVFDRQNAPRACYEWRFWQEPDSLQAGSAETAPEFDVQIGPFRFRPLRLHELSFDDCSPIEGAPRTRVAIVGVITADRQPLRKSDSPPRTLDAQNAQPLSADDAYPVGDLALLEYDTAKGSVTLQKTGLVELGYRKGKCETMPPNEEGNEFRLQLKIRRVELEDGVGRADPSKSTNLSAVLSVDVNPDIRAGVNIRAVRLESRLFGIDGKAQTSDVTVNGAGAYQFTFRFPKLKTSDLARIEISRMVLNGFPGDAVTLQLTAAIRLAIHTTAAEPRLEVANWQLGTQLQWLGLQLRLITAPGVFVNFEANHQVGVLFGHVRQRALTGELIRGMPVDASTLEALIALSGAEISPQMEWPSVRFRSGYAEFNTAESRAGDVQSSPQPTAPTAPPAVAGRVRFVHVLTWLGDATASKSFSRLLVDWPQAESVSAIGWPASFVDQHAAADASTAISPPVHEICIQTTPTLQHRVRPTIRRHELSLHLVSCSNGPDGTRTGTYVLSQPWSIRALVEHKLLNPADEGGSLQWRSYDDITIFDGELLQEGERAYAFAGRSRGGSYQGQTNPERIKHAGVVQRSLAQAGFPMDPIGLHLSAPTNPSKLAGLLAYGSSIAVVESADLNAVVSPEGFLFTMPWLLNLEGDPAKLGILRNLAQSGGGKTWRVSSADVVSAKRRPFDRASAVPLPLADASESGFEAGLIALFPGLAYSPREKRARYRGVEQPLFEPVDSAPPELADWPLWFRTLLTISAIWKEWQQDKPPSFERHIRILLQVRRRDEAVVSVSLPGPNADESATSGAAFAPLPDPKQPPFSTLLVIDDQAVRFVDIPASGTDTPGTEQRIAWRERAQTVLRVPKLILVGVGAGSSGPLCQPGHRSHQNWIRVEFEPESPAPSRVLRETNQTLHASPALGWPADPLPADVQDVAPGWLQGLHVGEEMPKQYEEKAIAGRATAVATGARAFSLGHQGFFYCTARRVVFENPVATQTDVPEIVGPPAVHLYPVPPRMRTLVDRQFKRFCDGRALAPILPGAIERFILGLRPGVLYLEYDGLVQPLGKQALDPALDHFGGRAEIGPIVLRQLRSPRSTRLPFESKLDRRRRTFLSRHDVTPHEKKMQGSVDELLPFRLLAGTATAFRAGHGGIEGDSIQPSSSPPSSSGTQPAQPSVSPTATSESPTSQPSTTAASNDLDYSIVIRPITPELGVVAGSWNGDLELEVSAANGANLLGILQSIGLLTKDEPKVAARTSFVAGAQQYEYPKEATSWMFPKDRKPEDPERIIIRLKSARPFRGLLGSLTADVPLFVSFVLHKAGSENDVLQKDQPPHTLTLPLRLRPTDRPTLPIVPATLLFGDPAYDRELGSAAASQSMRLDGRLFRFALDREAYDPEATIYLAFGEIEVATNRFITPESGQGKVTPGRLRIRRRPFGGNAVESPPFQMLTVAVQDLEKKKTHYLTDFELAASKVYSVPLSALRHLGFDENKEPVLGNPVDWDHGDVLEFEISGFLPTTPSASMTVYVKIVAEPVIAPPSAVYGLVLLKKSSERPAEWADVPLFASGPKPQRIEFPSLLDDLAQGHVRRRALYLWYTNFTPQSISDTSGSMYSTQFMASLVKFDRTGAGQLPNHLGDFNPVEDSPPSGQTGET